MGSSAEKPKVIPIRPAADRLPRVDSIEVEMTTTWEEIAKDVLCEAEEERRKRRCRLKAIRSPGDGKGPP
ncbi:MAG TPA: hypothetical protein VGL40_06885 [Bacillota bacterium]|jgi:hypothetical protein